jgi:sn-glycerol 3-phosphate transport system ATP-binding protein
MATIDIVDVRKVYAGKVEAIRGISLSISDGELVVLVGPSGCGKSTLLRMIAGLETITEGTISIDGRVVNKEEPAERDIAMVFQNYALYPHMTVRQNLEYGLKNRGTPRPEIDARVADAARILEIAPFLDRRPRQLSGGQRQRVAMGRAIVRQPKAFLFDEPLSNLDAKLRGQMRIEIRQLQRTLNTTSVYVTHDQLEAMTLADRLVVMNAGHIEQVGAPTELYRKPASLFVAQFIGSPPMNMIEVDYLREHAEGGLPDLPLQTDIVGARPERVSLVKPENPGLVLAGTVVLVEPVGAQSHVHVRLAGGGPLLVLETHAQSGFDLGSPRPIYVDVAALHPFSRETGLRTA